MGSDKRGLLIYLISDPSRRESQLAQCLFDKKKRNIELETCFSVFFLDEIQSRHQEQLKQPLLLRGITGSLGSVGKPQPLSFTTKQIMEW